MHAKGKSNPSRVRKGRSVSPFDEMAKEYDAWFDGEGRLIFLTEVRGFRALWPYLSKPWLEIGVGSGRFARALGIEAGIDPSANLVEIARSRGINARVGRGEVKIFDEQSFKAVFVILTLCFLDSPSDVLKEANRILTHDGKLILGVVLAGSPWGKLYAQKKKEGHRFYRYARFYSYDAVKLLLMQAGFKIEKTISTLFQEPGNVNRVEEPEEGFSPDAGFTIIMAGKQKALH
jgi:SAM-dependent methyltransferase